jgi:hypothetical protein
MSEATCGTARPACRCAHAGYEAARIAGIDLELQANCFYVRRLS